MRPDEHKKKRSAQYQRKHGGGGGKGAKNESDKSSSKSGKAGAAKVEKAPASHDALRRPQQDKKVDLSLSPSDSEDEDQGSTQGKSFRRREITSNWAKYDLPPSDAENAAATPKGEDFSKLLQGAGSATAHFRFKDEENWEDDGCSEGGVATQALSLDCNKLADSLDCLPLYAQLRLDTDIFSPEQKAAMDNSANEHRALAGLPPLHQQPGNLSPCPDFNSPSTSTIAPELSDNPQLSTDPKYKQQNSSIDLQNNLQDKAEDLKRRSAETKDAEKNQGASAGFSDADLDSLLEPSAAEEREVGVRKTIQAGKVTQADREDVTEKDLDDLLNMDAPRSNGPAASSSIGQTEAKKGAESEDLEDWLDSVLDS